eukprot:5108630-Amphidinium_carterae.2
MGFTWDPQTVGSQTRRSKPTPASEVPADKRVWTSRWCHRNVDASESEERVRPSASTSKTTLLAVPEATVQA